MLPAHEQTAPKLAASCCAAPAAHATRFESSLMTLSATHCSAQAARRPVLVGLLVECVGQRQHLQHHGRHAEAPLGEQAFFQAGGQRPDPVRQAAARRGAPATLVLPLLVACGLCRVVLRLHVPLPHCHSIRAAGSSLQECSGVLYTGAYLACMCLPSVTAQQQAV
jgi:hypothetical protein